jgi:hypothetical protein
MEFAFVLMIVRPRTLLCDKAMVDLQTVGRDTA